MRGVRPIERLLEANEAEDAAVARDYCLAVRAAITDDGRVPLDAPGLRLHARLTSIADSLKRVEQKGALCPAPTLATTPHSSVEQDRNAVAGAAPCLWVGAASSSCPGQ